MLKIASLLYLTLDFGKDALISINKPTVNRTRVHLFAVEKLRKMIIHQDMHCGV